MKKILIFITLLLITILFAQGCGTTAPIYSELEPKPILSPTPSLLPTPTLLPTVTLTPTPAPLEIKYQNYDSNYYDLFVEESYKINNIDDINELERLLKENYYGTWYEYEGDSIIIDEFTRDGRQYGIKDILDWSGEDEFYLTIYYYYMENPDVIYWEELAGDLFAEDGTRISTISTEETPSYWYSNVEYDIYHAAFEYEQKMIAEKYSNVAAYTIDQVYERAQRDARKAIYSTLRLDAIEQLESICHFDDIDDVYLSYDEYNALYTISFSVTYFGDWASAAYGVGGNTYFITCQYADQNGLKLVSIN